MRGKPGESLSPLPPSLSVCLSLSHTDTSTHADRHTQRPHQLYIGPPPVLVACRQPVILCSGSPVWSHLTQTKHCSAFFSSPTLSDMRQSSRYQSQHDEHCPFCLLSAFSFLSVSWPQTSPSHFQPFVLPLLVNVLYLSWILITLSSCPAAGWSAECLDLPSSGC